MKCSNGISNFLEEISSLFHKFRRPFQTLAAAAGKMQGNDFIQCGKYIQPGIQRTIRILKYHLKFFPQFFKFFAAGSHQISAVKQDPPPGKAFPV